MKKYCFLVQCGSHCSDLCGKLAILHTDSVRINLEEQSDAAAFTPGKSISWTPMSGGSCSAMIICNLSDSGYNEIVHEKHIKFTKTTGMNPDWFQPEQIREIKTINMWSKDN